MICLPRMWLMTGIGWMPYRWLCLFLPNWGQLKKMNGISGCMYEMYMFTRNQHGGSKKSGGLPLFNTEDGLWYRDYNYDPPYMDLKGGR